MHGSILIGIAPMPNGPDVLPTTARPVPARGIARLDPAAFGPDVPAGTRVSPDGAAVEFRTAAAAVLPPVTLAAVERLPTDAGERLRLTLDLHRPHPELRLPPRVDADDPGRGLRLFVGRPDVYRALTRAPVAVEVVVGGAIVRVCDGGVRPAGFDAVEAVLPVDPREPEPVRLLAEWAVCPEKFLFVDVVGPDASLLAGPTVHVDLLLDGASAAVLGEGVPPLQLHCVPVVNRRVVELPPVPLRRAGGRFSWTSTRWARTRRGW